MPGSRRSSESNLVQIVVAAFFLGVFLLAGFWQGLSDTAKMLYILGGVIVVGGGGVAIWFISRRLKHKRAEAWSRAMAAWQTSQQSGVIPKIDTSKRMTPEELEQFAAQVYRKMGYRILSTGHTGDHGIDVNMVNPNGQVELVQCKQWHRVVGEPEVRDLFGAMHHENAIRAFFWAPNGFSVAAQEWAKNKPIILADDREIGRLVESAYEPDPN